MAERQQTIYRILWGILLLLAGIGVFFRVPQVMPKIAQIQYFSSALIFIRFCFYLIGLLLICGGIKRIRDNYRRLSEAPKPRSSKK